MTEKEIEEMGMLIIQKLKKEGNWESLYDTIYFWGELDGYQYWHPDNSEQYLIMNAEMIKFDPKTFNYSTIISTPEEEDLYRKTYRRLKQKNPENFTEEAIAKRNYKKDLRLKQLSEEIDKILLGDEEE